MKTLPPVVTQSQPVTQSQQPFQHDIIRVRVRVNPRISTSY